MQFRNYFDEKFEGIFFKTYIIIVLVNIIPTIFLTLFEFYEKPHYLLNFKYKISKNKVREFLFWNSI